MGQQVVLVRSAQQVAVAVVVETLMAVPAVLVAAQGAQQ
jgi:hypothetical protein